MYSLKTPNPVVEGLTPLGPEATSAGGTNRFAGAGWQSWLALALPTSVLVVSTIGWHLTNLHVPIWDGANYVHTALNIRDAILRSPAEGLHALYLDRDWRPIVFPNAASVFFLLTGGSIRIGVAVSLLAVAVIAAIYIFLFLRLAAGRVRAAIGTTLVVTLAWFSLYTSLFYAEILWLGATMGVLYHLIVAIRGGGGTRWHWLIAGCWIGVAAAARPIESLVCAAPPALVLVGVGLARGVVRPLDILIFFAQLVLVSAAVALKTLSNTSDLAVASFILAGVLLTAPRAKRLFFETPVLGLLIVAEAVTVAWHLPSMQRLYSWVYETSFGTLAQYDTRFRGMSREAVIWQLLLNYSPYIFISLAALGLVAFIGGFRSGRISLRDPGPTALVGGALMLAPIITMYFVTGTSDPRRIMAGMLVTYVGILAICIGPAGPLRLTRLAVVAILALMQTAAVWANNFALTWFPLEKIQAYTGELTAPNRSPDGDYIVLQELQNLGVHAGAVGVFSYCQFALVENCERNNFTPFETFALDTVARERGLPLYMTMFSDMDFSKPERVADQVRSKGVKYLLIDMGNKAMLVGHPVAATVAGFIKLNGGPLPPGLTSLGCFSMGRPICVIDVNK